MIAYSWTRIVSVGSCAIATQRPTSARGDDKLTSMLRFVTRQPPGADGNAKDAR
jgi:hypothetical protein